jgi:hypothetical protein
MNTPILDEISNAWVFNVELNNSKTILTIEESCDYNYKIHLTKAEVYALAQELISLADTMK